MNKIVLSPEARNDFAEIRDYVEQELESTDAALKTIAETAKRRRRELEKHGKLGARLSSVTDVESEYRFLVCGNGSDHVSDRSAENDSECAYG